MGGLCVLLLMMFCVGWILCVFFLSMLIPLLIIYNGIVGIVYQTSAHYAIVLPVLNSKSSISCKIRRTDYFGSLKWSGGSSLYAWLRDIPRHSEFSLGDTVVTSGHSAVFPEGIPVGW